VRVEVERVKFDTALLQNQEVSGVEYQRGELAGWEVRSYLLEKFGRQCVYCGRGETAFELDHVRPRSRGGTNRVSNLVLACHACNERKGDQTASEFGHPEVEAQAWQPLRDAAAMNASRDALCHELSVLGLRNACFLPSFENRGIRRRNSVMRMGRSFLMYFYPEVPILALGKGTGVTKSPHKGTTSLNPLAGSLIGGVVREQATLVCHHWQWYCRCNRCRDFT
jgi:hypothetical protein